MFDLSKINKEELYRLIVDGDLHQSEQGFLGYLEREPGCLPAAFNALQYALTNLGDNRISPQLIIEIHHRILMDVKKINAGDIFSFRKIHSGYGFKLAVNADEQGVKMIAMRYSAFGTILTYYKKPSPYKSLEHFNTVMNELKPIKNPSEAAQEGVLFYRAPGHEHIENLIFFICESYNNAILLADSDEKKLSVIAAHLQYIDQLHPFSDGNIRICYILLQRMLIQHGFPPCMINQPNSFDACSTEGIVREIKEGMHNTQYLIDNPSKGIFGYITKKINETIIDDRYLAPEIKKSVESENNDLRNYYDSQDKLYQFISELSQLSHEDNQGIEQKNNALLIAILSWVRTTIFEQDPLQPILPDIMPDTQKISIVRRLLAVQNFFNVDPIEHGIELDYLLSQDGLQILTKYLDEMDKEMGGKTPSLIDSSPLIHALQFKKNQQKINLLIQEEGHKLTQYNDKFTQYRAERYKKNAIKKISFLEQFQQLMPEDAIDGSKHKLNQWKDSYKQIKREKNDALAKLEQWLLSATSYDLQADATLWEEIEEWMLQYQQLDHLKPDIAEKLVPHFPKKLNQSLRDIMNQWKEQYRHINDTYTNAMITLDDIRDVDTQKTHASRMRTKIIKNRVDQSLVINNDKINALKDLQEGVLQQTSLAELNHTVDTWIESNSHIMTSTPPTLTFFNPESTRFLQELRAISNNIIEKDEPAINPSSLLD